MAKNQAAELPPARRRRALAEALNAGLKAVVAEREYLRARSVRYAPAPALGSSIMTTSSSDTFYDSLAEFYDLIFEDWGASVQRQGRAIAELIGRLLPDATPPIRVLDAAAGIGTQSLPLAELGFELTCRDLSAAAIAGSAKVTTTRPSTWWSKERLPAFTV